MITLFDLPSNAPNKVWSPNTWKTRFCLNYKGLPYKTEWVEFPDIRALYEKFNVPANARPDGSPEPFYSLPAILDVDPATGKEIVITDSLKIAKYLDTTYPDTPRVLSSADDKAIQEQEAFARRAIMSFFPVFPNIFASKVLTTGNEASEAHATKKRIGALRQFFKEKYGSISSLDEVTFTDEEKKESFTKFLENLDGVGVAIRDEEGKVAWANGDTISFSDFAIAGGLYWIRAAVGEESQEWKMVTEWKGGKWVRFLNRLEPYATVA
ncbi:hypothetical protein BKA70DRAFT_1264076 [Coprinopsis sp. MPI-PUGE-AT-0042]|nr:hypothetical protein BKA70DRAFT_1267418 [Coprinopsis sp. MPI-PUGE-AT-0042]KAH6912525.1 hypothetical protein BKA70DRAFT_1264076 [Coprinopsis sp. MPI-PUGE-AT-0042]